MDGIWRRGTRGVCHTKGRGLAGRRLTPESVPGGPPGHVPVTSGASATAVRHVARLLGATEAGYMDQAAGCAWPADQMELDRITAAIAAGMEAGDLAAARAEAPPRFWTR